MSKARDFALALEIHEKLNAIGVTENAVLPEDGDDVYQPRTLIDNTLELIDPTPNIFTLFVQFNARFFWNKLLSAEVKWSNRMTSCAGICSFHPRNRQCTITLSTPLLKLRPRKDLVETLLHEMIHGYLFLTNNNRDRDGHGPEFHKHMHRINKDAGTNITVYHSFHDEVKLYQQHWWRCNGPCNKQAPYFGMVRRAMNRAPGPSDNWWSRHQQTCNGQFIKVREPEKPVSKNKKEPKGKKSTAPPKTNGIMNWITKGDNKLIDTSPITPRTGPSVLQNKPKNINDPQTNVNNLKNNPSNFTKLGNNSNNIHGWGVGGPSGTSSTSKMPNTTTAKNKQIFNASGTLGGTETGRSNLLDKFTTTVKSKKPKLPIPNFDKISRDVMEVVETSIKRRSNNSNDDKVKVPKLQSLPDSATCPVCNVSINILKLNDHLDDCLGESTSPKNYSTPEKKPTNRTTNIELTSPIVLDDSSDSDCFETLVVQSKKQKCLVCDTLIEPNIRLEDHLEMCIGSAFTDQSTGEFIDIDKSDCEDESLVKKFPCPICMTVVEESLMNQHLDLCLNKDLLETKND